MRRRLVLLTFVATLMLVLAGRAQSRTNFAGRWIPVDVSRAAALFDAGIIDVPDGGMSIAQDAKTLRIEPARSARAPRDKVFSLDGSESQNRSTTGTALVSTARWDGSRLVIATQAPGGQVTETYSMDGDQLKIETLARGKTTILVYRKAS